MMRALGVNDGDLAGRLSISRSAIQQWRTGKVKLREDQRDEMALALGVPAELFDQPTDEVLRWLADNRPEQVFAASG
jgi:transcriptional regulator with XRE-family HTH domain